MIPKLFIWLLSHIFSLLTREFASNILAFRVQLVITDKNLRHELLFQLITHSYFFATSSQCCCFFAIFCLRKVDILLLQHAMEEEDEAIFYRNQKNYFIHVITPSLHSKKQQPSTNYSCGAVIVPATIDTIFSSKLTCLHCQFC